MNHELKVMAARRALGLETITALIDAAHTALDTGIYSYSLGELATQYGPTDADSDRWFAAAMRELGIASPSRDEGITILLEEATACMIESAEPLVGMVARLYQDYVWLGRPDVLFTWAVYQYRIEESYLYHESGLIDVVEPAKELVDDILRHARTWNRDRWRPVIHPAWMSSTVLALAAAIREEKAFDRLPILADALQDAGCENEDILGHLRHATKHDRACWVVELLTEFGASN